MRFCLLFLSLIIISCGEEQQKAVLHNFDSVSINTIYEDSVSIRSLEILDDGSLAFAGSDGKYGLYNPEKEQWNTNAISLDSLQPAFRATAHTATDFFMLSIASPALLYKTGTDGRMQLVYAEEDSTAFYDAMRFWNNKEGIAIGDPVDACLSVIITRDGGKLWSKLPCDQLPELAPGEAAFAASNTNIAINGAKTWIITGGEHSRVYYSPDKGQTWEIQETPLIQGTATQGGYSVDFYDDKTGFVIGGDYTNTGQNNKNKILTEDGGKTWSLVAQGQAPGYQSSVQFVPNGNGDELVSMGVTGMYYSKNKGKNWTKLSDEAFYSFRFLDENTAYASGNGRIAKIEFSSSIEENN